jgi:photosystem II stability/assembly factor-like uncharacterized protein
MQTHHNTMQGYTMKKAIMFVLVLLFLYSCGINDPEVGEWQSLELEDKLVGKLHIIDNELYACAGRDGLYRKNLSKSNSEWEYLGHADTTVERALECGVTDIIKVNDELLVSYLAGFRQQKSGVYRSSDDGENWKVSDSGMITTPEYPTSSQVIRLLQRPSRQETIFASTATSLVYRSDDEGKSWNKVYGIVGASAVNYTIRINPGNTDEMWIGGRTGRFAPFLLHSTNLGGEWDEPIWFPQNLGPYTTDNSVYDIQIHPQNDSILYVGMLGLIAKTTDKCQTFQRILGWEDGVYRIWRIEINPNDPTEILTTGRYLYHSTDEGETWDKITPPDDRLALYALEVNWDKRILYVSSSSPDNGIYRYAF